MSSEQAAQLALHDRDPEVRRRAVLSRSRGASRRSSARCCSIALGDADWRVRKEAVQVAHSPRRRSWDDRALGRRPSVRARTWACATRRSTCSRTLGARGGSRV